MAESKDPGLRWWSAERQPWRSDQSAPLGVAIWLQVTDAAGERYKLPFPCKQTPDGWVNARNGAPLKLVVRPTGWRPYFNLIDVRLAPARSRTRPVVQQQTQIQPMFGNACSEEEGEEGA